MAVSEGWRKIMFSVLCPSYTGGIPIPWCSKPTLSYDALWKGACKDPQRAPPVWQAMAPMVQTSLQWRIQGALPACAPLATKLFSISCSFGKHLINFYTISISTPPEGWRPLSENTGSATALCRIPVLPPPPTNASWKMTSPASIVRGCYASYWKAFLFWKGTFVQGKKLVSTFFSKLIPASKALWSNFEIVWPPGNDDCIKEVCHN